MTVVFAKDGLPSQQVIKSLDSEAGSSGGSSTVMRSAVVSEIIGELAPLDRREELQKKRDSLLDVLTLTWRNTSITSPTALS